MGASPVVSSYLGRRGPPTPARVSEGPPHPRSGPRETGQEAREHIGLSSLRTPLSGARDGTRGCVGGGCGIFFLDFFFLSSSSRGCCWAGSGIRVCSLDFFALHGCRSGHRGRGAVSGGYRPILNQVNFPGSTQPARPARFQSSPAQPLTFVTGAGIVMLRSRTMVCGVYMWDCGVYMSCNVCMYACICMCWGEIEWGLLVLLPKAQPKTQARAAYCLWALQLPGGPPSISRPGPPASARVPLLHPSEIDEVFIPLAVV